MEEIKAKHEGGSAAFPRTDSTHSESTCFLFPCKIHFCYSVFLLIFAIEFKSTNFFLLFVDYDDYGDDIHDGIQDDADHDDHHHDHYNE